MYKIEKNIPIETRSSSKYGFMKDMDIGDSFLCGSTFVVHFRQYASRNGIKIKTRKMDENGHRIWRVG